MAAKLDGGTTVRVASAAELDDALGTLLPAEPHLEYANFKPISERPGAAVALHRQRWLDPNERDDLIVAVLACDTAGRPVAALRAVHRRFESEHFALRMAKVESPVASAEHDVRLAALRALYPFMCEQLRMSGYDHAALRAATRDPVAAWAAQEAGAVHVDTQVSWMCPLSRTPHDEVVPDGLVIEQHDRASVAEIPRPDWERIAAWSGEAFDRGPLVFDLNLPRSKARDVYREWTTRIMTGRWADAVLLARRRGEVVAFISMLHLADVTREAGVTVCGRGLGATLPEYRGMFTAIQREMIARRPLDADFMENETQVATIGSINVYAKLGMRYLRSTSTFHRWLGRRVEGGR